MDRDLVYLLLGPETGEKDEFIAKLKTSVAKKNGETPELHRFYPYDTQMSDVVSIMKNGSLFSASKFVLIQNVEEIKQNEAKILGEYCRNPAENVTLVLASDVINTSGLSSFISKAVKKDQTKIFWEMFEHKKQSWINSFFRSRKMDIEKEALELFLDLVENNTRDFRIACEGLSSYYGPGTTLTVDEIETFVYHSREENVFTLFEKITVADLGGALEIVSKMLLSGENNPVGIIGGLQFQFKRLLTLSQLIDRNYSSQEALTKAEIRGKRNGAMYMKGNSLYTTNQLEDIISRIADCDTALRSSSGNTHRILLDTFLYSVISKKGKPISAEIEIS